MSERTYVPGEAVRVVRRIPDEDYPDTVRGDKQGIETWLRGVLDGAIGESPESGPTPTQRLADLRITYLRGYEYGQAHQERLLAP